MSKSSGTSLETPLITPRGALMTKIRLKNTVKPVWNDHLYDKIYYLWLIQ